jgi:hypothetical protein
MKKIIINSPRRSGSTFLTSLVRNCLPVQGNLYQEKIDQGYTFAAKIDKWKTSHQNEIQVTTVRDPYDSIVSLLEADIAGQKKRGETKLATDDIAFIKKTEILLKSLEKYYLAIHTHSDVNHIAINFDRLKDEGGPRAIINKIFDSAGIQPIDNDFWELGYATAVSETSTTSAEIRHMPDGDEETYDVVKNRLELLKESISFNLVNSAYALALTKCVEV